ncbi:MAG: 16S rRNA (guanine(527)-N(7))-methyltransferase RsmG [Clostridia bacterium]|nr:16S rRNA (guanine(527)-N(7))-methyltransferase RsmG [Clostridia bacterium]
MTEFDFSPIEPICRSFGVELTRETKTRLSIYGDLLIEYNKSVNLTAIVEPSEIVIKHFLDCILFFKNICPKEKSSIIDIGTGAGFPGMVLLIIRPDLKLTLMDALEKRLNFLRVVLQKTGLSATLVHSRAEDGAKDPLYREQFDYATARAVAALPVLCELSIPYIKVGGYFVAMKGDAVDSEVAKAKGAFKILGADNPSVYYETLTGNEKRAFVVSKKISQTSPKYPRSFAKIKKNALK